MNRLADFEAPDDMPGIGGKGEFASPIWGKFSTPCLVY